jgi:hypothetical protein
MKRLLLLTTIFLTACGDTVLEITHEPRPWESETYIPKTVEVNTQFLFCPDTGSDYPNEEESNNILIKVESRFGTKSATATKYVVATEYNSNHGYSADAWSGESAPSPEIYKQDVSMRLSESKYEGETPFYAHGGYCLDGFFPQSTKNNVTARIYRDTLYFSMSSEMTFENKGVSEYEKQISLTEMQKNYPLSCDDVEKRNSYTKREISTYTYCVEIPDLESFETELSLAKDSAIKRSKSHLNYMRETAREITKENDAERALKAKEIKEKFDI